MRQIFEMGGSTLSAPSSQEIAMKPLSPLFAFLLPVLFIAPAEAQNQFNLGTLQSGQLMLNLNTTDQREVEQDTLNATLDFVQQGRDRTELQDQLNATMAQALELAKGASTIESNTSRYQAFIVNSENPSRTDVNNPIWRVQQSLELTSTDTAALLELAGKLQELGLTMSGLQYSLSNERYEEVAAELTAQALGTLQQRAEAAASSLGKGRAELVEVSLSDSPNFMPTQRGFSMAMSADAAMKAPVADPGKTQITVNLSARAVLAP
jgi:predicted secreted protein